MTVKTCSCGGTIVAVNFTQDQPDMHRHYAKAKLVGFTNPEGFVCANSRTCSRTYGLNDRGELQMVAAEEVCHAEREDLKDGHVWEIVGKWVMLG